MPIGCIASKLNNECESFCIQDFQSRHMLTECRLVNLALCQAHLCCRDRILSTFCSPSSEESFAEMQIISVWFKFSKSHSNVLSQIFHYLKPNKSICVGKQKAIDEFDFDIIAQMTFTNLLDKCSLKTVGKFGNLSNICC